MTHLNLPRVYGALLRTLNANTRLVKVALKRNRELGNFAVAQRFTLVAVTLELAMEWCALDFTARAENSLPA
jgi:hypothetical protein